jgi:CSLREA domain-containing protein
MMQSMKKGAAGRKRTLALGLLLATLIAYLIAVRPASADTTFTVTSTGDGADTNLDDNLCDASVSVWSSPCTLRAAIQEANDTPGADAIHFNIFGSGLKTISPNSFLPPITEAVSIDGYTQPGAEENTLAQGDDAVLKIELNGSNAGEFKCGLTINASNVVVRGLVINRFSSCGVFITGDGNKVEGNFLGTDPSGTQALGGSYGVYVNDGSDDNTIGGSTPAARNVISGNDHEGVYIDSIGEGNKVQGNYIGTTKNGTGALGNSDNGVLILYASNNTVGGVASAANTIAFNGEDGVYIEAAAQDPDNANGNRILHNAIFSNAEEGIDFNDDGRTPNDPGDADSGENKLQNFPVLTSASTSGGSTTIEGRLNSTPNQTFKVQFFSNPSDTDEGKTFIGQKNVTTGANGKVYFTFAPTQAVPVGQALTATATDADGNTSEFATPREVVATL